MLRQMGVVGLLALLVAMPACAVNPPAVEWYVTLTHGGGGRSVIQTTDGSYVVTGGTKIGDSVLGNVYLAKVDSAGALLWERGFGSSGGNYGNSVVQSPTGGFVIAGCSTDSGVALLAATDSIGQLQWQRTYDDSDKPVEAHQVLPLGSEGYIIVGTTGEDNAALIVRTNSLGYELAGQRYGNLGSSRTAYSGVLTSDGGCLIVGSTDSCGSGWFPDDVYLLKTTLTGTVVWRKVIGGTDEDRACAVVENPDSSYAVAGVTASQGSGCSDFYLLKVSRQGTLLWSRTYGTPDADVAHCLCHAADGGYALAGWTGGSPARPWIVRTDSLGNVVWTKILQGDGHGWINAIVRANDGGFVVSGIQNGPAFVAKLLPDSP